MIKSGTTSRVFYGWVNVLVAGIGHMTSVSALVFFTFGVFLAPLQQEFGWSRTAISAALIAAVSATIIMQPLAGYWSDRIGPKRIILASIVGFNIVFASMYFLTPSIWHLYLMFALLTTTGAGTSPITYCKVITEWFTERRGLALCLSLLGVGLGASLAPVLANTLIEQFGWRMAYVGLAAIGFTLSFPLIALFLVNAPRDRGMQPYGHDRQLEVMPDNYGLGAAQARRTLNFWVLIIVFLLAGVTLNGTMLHMVPMLIDSGVSAQTAAMTAGLLGVSLMVGRVIAGLCLDRFFGPHVALVFMTLPIIGLGIFLGDGTGVLVYVAAISIGLALGAEIDIVAYFVGRYFGIRAYSQIYGFIFAAFSVGTATGPIIMGVVYDTTGSYQGAQIAFIGILLLCCFMLSRLSAYPEWGVREDQTLDARA
ncbi:MAG: MFS transporter [Gammaproteobacteria bacterium]|nr:MFS transporter [Gammaproteobacteria bacterium]